MYFVSYLIEIYTQNNLTPVSTKNNLNKLRAKMTMRCES